MQDKNQLYWTKYQNELLGKFLLSLTDSDFQGEYNAANVMALVNTTDSRKAAFKILKQALSAKAFAQLSNRFRAYVFRLKNGKKTLFVTDSTLTKLAILKDNYEAETFDEMFDYLLSPKYNQMTEEAVVQLCQANRHSETELSKRAAHLAERLTLKDRVLLNDLLELAFMSGWQAARQSRSKSPTAMTDACAQFMDGQPG